MKFRHQQKWYEQLENKEKKEAIENLIEMGVLIPFDEHLKLYHGNNIHVDSFGIDPFYYKKYADNIHLRSTLYTSQDYEKVKQIYGSEDTVHQIIPKKEGYFFFDIKRASKLTDNEISTFIKNIVKFLPKPDDVPIDFDEYNESNIQQREQAKKEIEVAKKQQRQISINGFGKNRSNNKDYRPSIYEKTIGMYNSAIMMFNRPDVALNDFLRDDSRNPRILGTKYMGRENGEDIFCDYPRNREYIGYVLKQLGVVGVHENIKSASAGGDIEVFSIFDMNGIDTKRSLEKHKESIKRLFLDIEAELEEEFIKNWEPKLPENQQFKEILSKPYSSAEDLIKAIKSLPNLDSWMEKEVGVREGFTLEEHTETVLRTFEHNFADMLPVYTMNFMRLAIMIHDLGKPVGREKEISNSFLTNLEVPENLKQLLLTITTDSAKKAHEVFIKKTPEKIKKVRDHIEKSQNKNRAKGGLLLSKILLECDGGAYTEMAFTRRRVDNVLHRNKNPRFEEFFKDHVDITRQNVQLKDDSWMEYIFDEA